MRRSSASSASSKSNAPPRRALREALDAATFKTEILEKSYAKQLAEARDKHAALESELKEKEEILAGLGGGHEHTLRELSDAVAVIKVLKADRDQLRKQVAQAGFREPARPRRARRLARTPTARSMRSSPNTRVEKESPGSEPARQPPRSRPSQESPHEEMLSPDLVFTAKDKEKDDER